MNDRTWPLLLALRVRRNCASNIPVGRWTLSADGTLAPARIGEDAVEISSDDHVRAVGSTFDQLLVERYAATATVSSVVGHLGQSADGFIATEAGDSYYVTGPENLDHLHRMRALADAVVVGGGTVATDDPALTTRRVPGPSPVRVVLDPDGRLPPGRRVFADGSAPTLWITAAERSAPAGHVTVITAPSPGAARDPDWLIACLRSRDLRALFVEGGGVTVSRFLEAGRLDRLQLAIAPVVLGRGRRALTVAPPAQMADAMRPPARLSRMGADAFFEFDLRAPRWRGNRAGPAVRDDERLAD